MTILNLVLILLCLVHRSLPFIMCMRLVNPKVSNVTFDKARQLSFHYAQSDIQDIHVGCISLSIFQCSFFVSVLAATYILYTFGWSGFCNFCKYWDHFPVFADFCLVRCLYTALENFVTSFSHGRRRGVIILVRILLPITSTGIFSSSCKLKSPWNPSIF